MTRASPRPVAFPNVCVVGLGNHAKSKLIPALQANGQRVAGVVTSQATPGIEAATFNHLGAALAATPNDTLFVLASPPALHATQAMQILNAGRDVIVEKPAFVTHVEAENAFALAARHDAVLVEAFMHRHTACYQRARTVWRNRSPQISRIEIVFTIPTIPDGTFRARGDLASSGLYDMGCYGLSLLDDLSLPLNAIELTERSTGRNDGELISLEGAVDGISLRFQFGVAPAYANILTFVMQNGDAESFTPFFYGRPGTRTCLSRSGNQHHETTFEDRNAFEAMFATPRGEWLSSQSRRAGHVYAVTAALERLGEQLQTARRC